jgi:rod shape-determining protein MreC
MAGMLPPAERRTSALVALYVALSLLLLLIGERLPQAILRGAGATLFAPIDRIVLAGDRLAASWRENQRLHQRVTELELENARMRDAVTENSQLRERLGLAVARDLTLRPVELLALSGEPVPASATLSAGWMQGARAGDVVVTSDGLVGRVTEVYPASSRAAMLTDPNAPVACVVESTGVLGIVRFVNAPRPRLLFTAVPFTDTVRVGQKVLTSSLSRRYPRGIPVGVVTGIGRDPSGLMQLIEITPAARMSRLRHVFLLPGPGPVPSGLAVPAPGAAPPVPAVRR